MQTKKLEWNENLSVGVEEIDNQHKGLIATINTLVEQLGEGPNKEKIDSIVDKLVGYKMAHFATEEKYFKEFNYEGATEHIAAHRSFGEKLEELRAGYDQDPIGFPFALVDFLEDWLINHMMTMDMQYVECFKQHGLK